MNNAKAPTSPGALSHIRVLDLTRVRAGPTCCRILADFGADVIKVEAPPGVDPNEGMSGARHGYDMLNLHRNKRSLTLNMKKPEGLKLFLKMAAQSDVVVENFRPDVKNRLGIDYDALSAVNPRIILASVSGFGQDGPYVDRAGFDQIAQGMGGLMSVTGEPGRGPMRAGTAVADSSAGIYAATGILAALAEREQSGRGQWVHTSLLEAQIALMDFQGARYLVDGESPGQAGNDHPFSTPMGVVEVTDGYINIGVGGDGQWRGLCDALKHPEWGADERFATLQSRFDNRPLVWSLVRPVFAEQSREYWLDELGKFGVPAGPIYNMEEVFADPQVQHLGIAKPMQHHARGNISVVGQPVTLSRTPATYEVPPPDPGEHNQQVLSDLGLSDAEIAELSKQNVI